MCKLLDYGVDEHHAFLVLHAYPCSLREWRALRSGPPADSMHLYLSIFASVVKAVQVGLDPNPRAWPLRLQPVVGTLRPANPGHHRCEACWPACLTTCCRAVS